MSLPAISSKRPLRSAPCKRRTFRSGANFRASFCQLAIRLVGAMIRAGLSSRSPRLFQIQQRQNLHGFAEAHVIGQNAAEAGLA